MRESVKRENPRKPGDTYGRVHAVCPPKQARRGAGEPFLFDEMEAPS